MRTMVAAALLLAPCASAYAKGHGDNDRASFGQDITVGEGETASDVACAFCNVHIRGEVTGDVAVFWGSVDVAPQQEIHGDLAVAMGDVTLGDGASVNGDTAIMGGELRAPESASVHGDRVRISRDVGLLILLSPFILLGLLIWLIVYLIRRNRYRFPAYPQGRGVPPMPR